MPSYFILIGKTNYRKKNRKERLNRKENRKTLPVAWAKPAHPAQPAQRGTGVFFPDRAPPSCSVDCHRASRARRRLSRRHLPLWSLLDAPRSSWRRHASIPPLWRRPHPLSRQARRRPERRCRHAVKNAWPSSPRSCPVLSLLLVVPIFITEEEIVG